MPYSDKEKQKSFQRNHIANKNRIKRICVLEFLGGKCVRCEVDDYRCLQIDHINPIMGERLKGVITVNEIYLDREDIDNLQVLCANCHMIKTYREDIVSYPGYIG